MTDIQQATFNAVKELEFKLGYKPEPLEVAEHMGKNVNHLLRVLSRIGLYDAQELLTESELIVMDIYQKSMKLKDIEKLSGLSPAMVKHTLNSLAEKGLIIRKKYKKANRDEAPPTYVCIVEGKYKGYRGYIGKNDKCTVFNCNGEEVTKFFEPNEYDIIERRV